MRNCLKTWMAATAITLFIATSAHAAPVTGQGTWQTTLQARDLNGDTVTDAFYDTTLNITWLRDANVNGVMNWADANAWAAGYSIGGYDDWRLPTMVDTGVVGCSFSCFNVETATSEMASLWYDTLGNKSRLSISGELQIAPGLTNTGDFLNMQSRPHWFGLEYALDTNLAWVLRFGGGGQGRDEKYEQFYAMAVRPGDILAAQVPEPESLLLALTALGALALARRRRAVGALPL